MYVLIGELLGLVKIPRDSEDVENKPPSNGDDEDTGVEVCV